MNILFAVFLKKEGRGIFSPEGKVSKVKRISFLGLAAFLLATVVAGGAQSGTAKLVPARCTITKVALVGGKAIATGKCVAAGKTLRQVHWSRSGFTSDAAGSTCGVSRQGGNGNWLAVKPAGVATLTATFSLAVRRTTSHTAASAKKSVMFKLGGSTTFCGDSDSPGIMTAAGSGLPCDWKSSAPLTVDGKLLRSSSLICDKKSQSGPDCKWLPGIVRAPQSAYGLTWYEGRAFCPDYNYNVTVELDVYKPNLDGSYNCGPVLHGLTKFAIPLSWGGGDVKVSMTVWNINLSTQQYVGRPQTQVVDVHLDGPTDICDLT